MGSDKVYELRSSTTLRDRYEVTVYSNLLTIYKYSLLLVSKTIEATYSSCCTVKVEVVVCAADSNSTSNLYKLSVLVSCAGSKKFVSNSTCNLKWSRVGNCCCTSLLNRDTCSTNLETAVVRADGT